MLVIVFFTLIIAIKMTKEITREALIPSEVVVLSIDNTQWFENKNLNELYVNEWEMAARVSKEVIDLCKSYGIKIINVFDNHPLWHVLFAANYNNKKPYDLISYDEVKDWTEKDNQIWDRAEFSLEELKSYLKAVWNEVLWPDHCIQGTQWAKVNPPLVDSDFDYNVSKWEKVVNSWYSAFDHTKLDELLKSKNIKKLILTWVATDYCVWQSAIDAQNLWYNPIIISDAVRGVAPDTTSNMVNKLSNQWIKVITKDELLKLLKGS